MSEKRLPVVESGWTRRDVLRGAAAALTTYGVLDLQGAAVAHAILQEAQAGAGYEPRWFKAHEWETVGYLADLILPADTVSVSASAARVPEFIDLMCSESVRLQRVFSSGLLWLDAYTRRAGEGRFVEATAERQAEILDLLAAHGNESEPPGYEGLDESVEYAGFFDYGVGAPSELQPGATFFGWIRRLTVDGFYSSPEGIEDVGYLGNGYSRRYTVPQEAIQYALSRSPFAEE